MDNFRILKRFSPEVRQSLKETNFQSFTDAFGDEKVCGTGHCPIGLALDLSGANLPEPIPVPGRITWAMINLGLATQDEFNEVLREAYDFIQNYRNDDAWKESL